MRKGAARLITLFGFLFLFLFISPSVSANGADEGEVKPIRVAYPILAGLTTIDEHGNYTGYSYDYLMEIAQYTGWNYEFVRLDGDINTQLLNAMDMLQRGELDLIGSMNFSDELAELYSYPGYCYGNNYSGLFVPEDSDLTESSIYVSRNIKVGVFSKNKIQSQKLIQFAQMNQLNVEQIVVDGNDRLYELLEEGSIDAVLSTDIAMAARQDMHAIVHFSPVPFYFTTTKGNVDIVRQLDYAVSMINKVNPNFSTQLYTKYFSGDTSSLTLSKEERNYIENCGVLEVAMYKNKPPFQYLDPKTGKPAGVTVEILQYISQATGLEFHYNQVETFEEYTALLMSGQADIAGDMLLNYQDAADLNSRLTVPWHTLPLSIVLRKETAMGMGGRYAVPYFLKNVVSDEGDVVYYDTVEQCMEAVRQKKADYSYVGEYCSQYYLNSGHYDDLKVLPQPDSITQKLSFGIPDSEDFTLLSLFNKALTSMTDEQIEDLLYRNTYQPQNLPLWVLIRNNKGAVAVAVMTVVVLVSALMVFVKSRQQRRIAFENSRYSILSNLANEYFYEYDVQRDRLTLSDKCAEFFFSHTGVDQFSKKLAELEEKTGIWQFGDYITGNMEGSPELLCQMPDGSHRWFSIISSAVYNQRKKICIVGKLTDIQEEKTEKIRLEQRASRDGLTGVYNIATIKNMIKDCLADADSYPLSSLMILDIDNFKQINDQFGHYSGDSILVLIAGLIADTFQPGMVGRLGGDEFVVFSNSLTADEIGERCRILGKKASAQSEELLGKPFTVSMGVAFVQTGQSYAELYQEADMALYQTKSTSKDGYTIYKREEESSD